jgi:hypothetical protein
MACTGKTLPLQINMKLLKSYGIFRSGMTDVTDDDVN